MATVSGLGGLLRRLHERWMLWRIRRIEARLDKREKAYQVRHDASLARDADRIRALVVDDLESKVGPLSPEMREAVEGMGGSRDALLAMRPGMTTDPADPRLTHGVDEEPVGQAAAYLVLSDEERAKGFVRPVRRTYVHIVCGTETSMAKEIAETYARNPSFYGGTYCVHCARHLPVGEKGEFYWKDGGGMVGT